MTNLNLDIPLWAAMTMLSWTAICLWLLVELLCWRYQPRGIEMWTRHVTYMRWRNLWRFSIALLMLPGFTLFFISVGAVALWAAGIV
jgi:uncharacterized membrane protein